MKDGVKEWVTQAEDELNIGKRIFKDMKEAL